NQRIENGARYASLHDDLFKTARLRGLFVVMQWGSVSTDLCESLNGARFSFSGALGYLTYFRHTVWPYTIGLNHDLPHHIELITDWTVRSLALAMGCSL